MKISDVFKGLVCITGIVIPWLACAQNFEVYPIEFLSQHTISNSYAGGMVSPQFSEMDINMDGKKDMIVFEKSSAIFIPYINEGESGNIKYRFDQSMVKLFPRIKTWAMFRDFNRDGVEDIFVGSSTQNGGIEVWQSQLVDGEIQFFNVYFENSNSSILKYSVSDSINESILLPLGSFPDFLDIDGDGDLDILTFDQTESYILYYKNMQVERGLALDVLEYVLYDECFGKFVVDIRDSKVVLSDDPTVCKEVMVNTHDDQIRRRIHGGSSIMGFDQNCDGLIDLLLGDGSDSKIKLVVNGGTKENAFMIAVKPEYPVQAIDISYFASTYSIDVNNDGAKDLIAVHNNTRDGQSKQHIWLYINEGQTCAPIFKLFTKSWLADDMFYFCAASSPALSDVNGDGLVDVLVGGHIVKTDTDFENRLVLFLNIGTPDVPKFQLFSDDYLNFSSIGVSYSGRLSPSFGDLDGDGAVDLVIGDGYGTIYYVKNLAAPGKPYNFDIPIGDYSNFMVGANAIPNILDLDKDGLNDLLIAKWRHDITFYKNIGTPGAPSFIADPSHASNVKNLGKIFDGLITEGNLNGAPYFYTSKGEQKMILGTKDGSLRMYNNILGPSSIFNLETELTPNLYFGGSVHPTLGNLNGDNFYELILGNQSGGLIIYKTDIQIKNLSSDLDSDEDEITVFPNPTSDIWMIQSPEFYKVSLVNVEGRLISEQIVKGSENIQFDATGLPQGMYILRFMSDKQVITKKVMKVE